MARFSRSTWFKLWTSLTLVVIAAVLFGTWPPSPEPAAGAQSLAAMPAAAPVVGGSVPENPASQPGTVPLAKTTPTAVPTVAPPPGPRPPLAGDAPSGRSSVEPRSVGAVLYDQYNNAAAQGTNSQNFGFAGSALNVQVADDFTVPSDQQWTVSQVDVAGAYINGAGPAASVNVQFFNTVNGAINNSPFISQTVAIVGGPNPGDFQIALTPVILDPGTYWVSVVANESFGSGQWIWLNRTIQSGGPAMWRNVGAVDCFTAFCGATFSNRATSTNTPGAPDQVFRISGASASICTVAHYDVVRTTGNPIVHATQQITMTGGTSSTADDDHAIVTPPFAVQLFGTSYPTMTVGTNGFIDLGPAPAPDDNQAAFIPTPKQGAMIAPHWDDLHPSLTISTTYGVFTDTLGVAPNRKFVVEWITGYFGSEVPGSVNFQVIFYENELTRITTLYGRDDRGVKSTVNDPIAIGIQNTNHTRFATVNTDQPILSGTRIDYVDHLACPPAATPTTVTSAPPTAAGTFFPVSPVRVLDTRGPTFGPIGFDANGAALTGNQSYNHTTTPDIVRAYRIGGKSFTFNGITVAVPAGIRGILANVTVVQPTPGGGFVTLYSADLASPPGVSTVNPQVGGVSFNLTYSDVGRSGNNVGNLAIHSVGDQTRDIIVDLLGFYQ